MEDTKLILIVEDEEIHAAALEFILQKNGYRTEVARNGKDGLDKALSIRPNLVVLDVLMPVMDGLTVLKKLNEDEWGKSVPVIILSNLNENEELRKMNRKGYFDYVLKSDYSLAQLMNKVKKGLE